MTKSLEFTLTVSNCLSCSFCPQSDLAAGYHSSIRVMTMPVFTTLLEKLPPDCSVDFSGYSEPFLNPLAADMIHMASDSGRVVNLFTTLAGFSEKQVFQLARSKIAYTRLHLPDAIGFKMDADVWLRKYRLFAASGQSHTAMAMTDSVDPKIMQEIHQHGVRVEHPVMLSRGGLLWKDKHLAGPIRCAANRWHNNVAMPDGSIQACCMAFNQSLPLGNLLTQPYSEIEAKANEYASNGNPPDDSICRDCDWAAPL